VKRDWARIASAALCGSLVVAAVAAAGEPGFSRSVTPGLMDHFARLFGRGARQNLIGWKDFVSSAADRAGQARANSGEADLLRPVNGYFNRVSSVTDLQHWGVEDYWATPAEFLSSRGGDCEDYAIAKYFALKELGVPVSRLRLVYATTSRASGAHMVLAYFSAPGADPLIMDNLERRIGPASGRPDLIPVYLFNDDELEVLQRGAPAIRRDAHSNRKWQEVLAKLAREQTF
jgi:predicted transglutaminase-like cysteine proteinase